MNNSKLNKTAILALMGLALVACNTMEGVGKDIEAGGDKLEDSADRNNTYKGRSN